MADRFTPIMGAALLAWILCVCVHEFSHALVAYIGGDKSVREKGYLTLDPTRFIDPVFSLLVPAVVLMLGGLPLPGGSVQIDVSRLKSEAWSRYVSAAGPISNFVLFLLFAAPLHPELGFVDPAAVPQPTWVYFFGAMAVLNFIATLFNLIPVPPLDGFALIEHRFRYETRLWLRQNSMLMFGGLFMLFWMVDEVWVPFFFMVGLACDAFGLPEGLLFSGFFYVVWGASPLD